MLQTSPIFEIIEVPISKVNPQHLFEKQPIIIKEPLVSTKDLTTSLFKYLFLSKKYRQNTIANVYQQNKAKYMIIYPRENNLILQVVHPKKSSFLKNISPESLKHVEYVEFRLKRRQVMILPMYWWYNVNSEKFGRIELDDVLSFVLGRI